jgi:hypothetical protein
VFFKFSDAKVSRIVDNWKGIPLYGGGKIPIASNNAFCDVKLM